MVRLLVQSGLRLLWLRLRVVQVSGLWFRVGQVSGLSVGVGFGQNESWMVVLTVLK